MSTGTITSSTGKRRQLSDGERRAIEATRKFRSLIPALKGYAEDIMGHTVKIVPGPNTQTDGETVWIRPPSELADDHPHIECGVYDEARESVCPACRVIDNVLLYLHHEMSHIMHGSFETYMFDGDVYQLVRGRLEKHITSDTEWPEHTFGYTFQEANTLEIASGVYPPLVAVVQALEDHRINEAHYRQGRDHLREQMKADCQRIIDEGSKMPDGSVVSWADADKNQQMMIQMLFDLQGNDYVHILNYEVLKDYEELGIATLTQDVANKPDSLRLLLVAAEVTGRCMTRGYFQKDADMEALMDLLRILFGHGLTDKNAEREVTGQAIPTAEDEQRETEFEDGLRETLLKGQHLEGAPVNIAGLTVHEYPKGKAFDAGADTAEAASVSARNRAVNKARFVFEKNARVEHVRNQRRGKLNGRTLGKRAWSGDERLFSKRIVPDTRKYGVVIGLDISGSTSGGRLEVIKSAALAMADVCHRTGVSFEIYAHTGGMEGVPGTDRPAANVYTIKSKSDPWDTKRQEVLRGIGCGGINLDGHTMQFYRKRLDDSGCTDNVLFYFTDGSMPAANYEEEREVLERELALMKRRGYTVVGVGVDTDSPKQYGLDTVIVHGPDDIAAVLEKMASRIG